MSDEEHEFTYVPSVQYEQGDAVGDGQQEEQHRGRRQLLITPGEQPADVQAQVNEKQQPERHRQRHRREVHRAGLRLPTQLCQR